MRKDPQMSELAEMGNRKLGGTKPVIEPTSEKLAQFFSSRGLLRHAPCGRGRPIFLPFANQDPGGPHGPARAPYGESARTHLMLLCRQPPCRLAPRSPVNVLARSRTWSSTLGESRAIRHTPRTLQYPAEPACGSAPSGQPDRTPSTTFEASRAFRHTPRTLQYPAEESNPVYDVRSVACVPAHSQGNGKADAQGRAGMISLATHAPIPTGAASLTPRIRRRSSLFAEKTRRG